MRILIIVYLGGLLFFHFLESVAPVKPDYPAKGKLRRGFWADIVASVVNGPGVTGLEKIAFFWLVTRFNAQVTWLAGWSRGAQFALFFLVNDFARYWLHRWYHDAPDEPPVAGLPAGGITLSMEAR